MLDSQVPKWGAWYRYLCYIRFPWRALMIDQARFFFFFFFFFFSSSF